MKAIDRAAEEKERALRACERATAAIQRSDAALRRAELSKGQAQRVHERFEGLQGSANPGEGTKDRTASLAAASLRLRERQAGLRARAIELAVQIASEAEAFASALESGARRGDQERRLTWAASERRVARSMRAQVARWRLENGNE